MFNHEWSRMFWLPNLVTKSKYSLKTLCPKPFEECYTIFNFYGSDIKIFYIKVCANKVISYIIELKLYYKTLF